jgi:hypothetical protein
VIDVDGAAVRRLDGFPAPLFGLRVDVLDVGPPVDLDLVGPDLLEPAVGVEGVPLDVVREDAPVEV